ncbi:DUF4279 domain-containing protein [Leptolyngbya sp. AN02str]|uniref:DUF4279 domain-containing protein n=1 Tax=Leptolyngbya sp. AN02str TaxID=3423363 RepID=UPI003D32247B
MSSSKHYLNNNPACKETHLRFGILGSDLEPDEVTRVLQIQPHKAFAKGDLFETRSGQHKRSSGLWSFNTKSLVNSTSPEIHAEYLLDRIEPRAETLKSVFQERGYRLSISVWWEGNDYHGGFTLSTKTLRRLSCICEEISFFFISSDSEECDRST